MSKESPAKQIDSEPASEIDADVNATEKNKLLLINATKKTFPVVGIGATAGGLSAYNKLLKELSIDTG